MFFYVRQGGIFIMAQNICCTNPESLCIPLYRNQYIDIKLNELYRTFGLKNNTCPVDCVKLLNSLKNMPFMQFTYTCLNLPSKYDAITQYYPKEDVYIMLINKNKVTYPFKTSKDRRLNFTIAHELGHIFLEHLLIPTNAKTPHEIRIEEMEANEFAGRLLMPKEILLNCNYYSIDSVAKYFNVSKSALLKRLQNLELMRLLASRKVRACSRCGNTHFTVLSFYCGICGNPMTSNRKAIRCRRYPALYPTDMYMRVSRCPSCLKDLTRIQGEKCPLCGTYIFNFCTSFFEKENSECSHANHGHYRYCEMCGRPTYYFSKKLLKPWHEEDEVSIFAAEEPAEYFTSPFYGGILKYMPYTLEDEFYGYT